MSTTRAFNDPVVDCCERDAADCDCTTTDAGIPRTVRIIRDTYRIVSTEDGYSDREDVDTDVTEWECTGDPAPFYASPAREAVTILRRENLGTLEGADWFGYPDPYSHPYRDEESETTAHLVGAWTDTERRAIARMVAWCEARDDQRAREYASRF